MKIKTSELEGAALDWAVAKSIGKQVTTTAFFASTTGGGHNSGFCVWDESIKRPFRPSTNWSQGGPLIEKWTHELLNHGIGEPWTCRAMSRYTGATKRLSGGAALTAAMRAIVASEIGDEVDVPEELL